MYLQKSKRQKTFLTAVSIFPSHKIVVKRDPDGLGTKLMLLSNPENRTIIPHASDIFGEQRWRMGENARLDQRRRPWFDSGLVSDVD